MSNTKIKASQFHGVVGHGTDGYFLMTNGDGSMTWVSNIINPTITNVDYPGTATAADLAGGESITLTGTGFKTGATVTIGGTSAPSVSYVSATELTITTPAKTAGDYDIVVTNTDTGSATFVNGISYNGVPTWTTAAGSLGTFASEETISTITLQASEPDAGTITFNITNGALPTGLSLTGANIDGTTSLETADTLYTFTVTATDDENQATPRTFTITVEKAFVPSENFNIVTYSGNDSTRSITVGFQPDLIITKSRNTAYSHMVTDSVRGGAYNLRTNSSNAEESATTINFESNGYEIVWNDPSNSDSWNGTGNNYVAWCWKGGGTAVSNTDGSITSQVSANTAAGFSIVSYTGTGSNTNFGHGLDSIPELTIIKNRDDGTRDWIVHPSSQGNDKYLVLNGTNTINTSSIRIQSVSSTVVNIGTNTEVNANGQDFICYNFHSVDGYQKIGSYTGNGSATGPTVTTGFQPRFLIIKRTDIGGAWCIFDSIRDATNPISKMIVANESSDEYDLQSEFSIDGVDFLSNGFQLKDANSSRNASGGTYIYLAIA